MELARMVVGLVAVEEWKAYSVIDEILSELAGTAGEMLAYHSAMGVEDVEV
jgi:hypothetical protein